MSRPSPAPLVLYALPGVPEVAEGDDLAALLADALRRVGLELTDGDVLVVSSKVVSKALGLRAPASERAALVMREAEHVVAERATAGGVTRIVRTLAGPTLAGAGIDASNVGDAPGADTVLLLPRDPDEQARLLRRRLAEATGTTAAFGVILSDTSGRPWRAGQTDYALGATGVPVLDDLRGRVDTDGRPLHVTVRAVGDELASAADLLKGKDRAVAAVLVRGAPFARVGDTGDDAGAAPLTRARADDWFALGSREAVLTALGLPPGSHGAEEVGLPRAGAGERRPAPHEAQGQAHGDDHGRGERDGLEERIERACRAAVSRDAYPPLAPHHPRAALQRVAPLDTVRTQVVQTGVRIEAPDEFTLGLVTARLVVALAAEGVAATPARSGHGAPPASLGLPATAAAIGSVLFV